MRSKSRSRSKSSRRAQTGILGASKNVFSAVLLVDKWETTKTLPDGILAKTLMGLEDSGMVIKYENLK